MQRYFNGVLKSLFLGGRLFILFFSLFLVGCKYLSAKNTDNDVRIDAELIKELPKEELICFLEQESGLNEQDSSFHDNMAALRNNPNTDLAYISINALFIKLTGDSVYHIYPNNYFNASCDTVVYRSIVQAKESPSIEKKYSRTGRNGKVAVFNYFSNHKKRNEQNEKLNNLCELLQSHDYGIEYYPYEGFNLDNLYHVSSQSDAYHSVIIVSEGVVDEISGLSYYAVADEYDNASNTGKFKEYFAYIKDIDKPKQKAPWLIKVWEQEKENYNLLLPMNHFYFENSLFLTSSM